MPCSFALRCSFSVLSSFAIFLPGKVELIILLHCYLAGMWLSVLFFFLMVPWVGVLLWHFPGHIHLLF